MNLDKLKIVKSALKAVKMHEIATPPPRETSISSGATPYIRLDVKEAPFLKGYEVGDLCTIVIKTKISSHNAHKSSNGPSEDSYGLEVCSMGQISHTPVGKKEEPGEY